MTHEQQLRSPSDFLVPHRLLAPNYRWQRNCHRVLFGFDFPTGLPVRSENKSNCEVTSQCVYANGLAHCKKFLYLTGSVLRATDLVSLIILSPSEHEGFYQLRHSSRRCPSLM